MNMFLKTIQIRLKILKYTQTQCFTQTIKNIVDLNWLNCLLILLLNAHKFSMAEIMFKTYLFII